MHLKLIPLVLPPLLTVALIITFSLAVYRKHITYFLPYISDSGAYPPESCIFGQVLNLFSFILVILMYVRYRQVRHIFQNHSTCKKNYKLNRTAFYIGLLAACGISIVGNFQETVMLNTHWAGALATFGFGSIYMCIQAKLSFMIYPICGTKRVNAYRVILATFATLNFIIFVPTGLIAMSQFRGKELTKWKEEDGGFKLHLVSTVCEWLTSGCIMIYLILFAEDFKRITIKEPDIFVETNDPGEIHSGSRMYPS